MPKTKKYSNQIIKNKKVKLAAANLAEILITEIPEEKDFYEIALENYNNMWGNTLPWLLAAAYNLLFESASEVEQKTEKKFNILLNKKFPSLLPVPHMIGAVSHAAMVGGGGEKTETLNHQNFPLCMQAAEKEIKKLKNEVKELKTKLNRLNRIEKAKNNTTRIYNDVKKQTKPFNKKSAKLKELLRIDYYHLTKKKGLTKKAAIKNLRKKKKYSRWTESTINTYLNK